jgi:hypothetical protein
MESGIGYSLEFKNVYGHFAITILMLLIFIVVPFLSPFQVDTPWLFYTQIVAYTFGAILMVKRVLRDIQAVLPMFLSSITPVGLKHESYSKRSTMTKIKPVQENTVSAISHVEEDSVIEAYFGKALSNFSNLKDETVSCGGLFWGWRQYISKEIFIRKVFGSLQDFYHLT